MATSQDPGSRAVEAARRAAELRQRPEQLNAGRPVTQDDVEQAERRVEQARVGAAHAAHSAARSLDESARLHEEVAQIEDKTIEQGASRADVHGASVAFHRRSAELDHKLAVDKRKEAEADEVPGIDE
jgi:hypothetical protein